MPFAILLGVELLDARPELVRATLEWTPERCTAGALMHGGALMALAAKVTQTQAFHYPQPEHSA
jgi:1,4-dihydroxy-2-naphthoyl-CoA hydrolase